MLEISAHSDRYPTLIELLRKIWIPKPRNMLPYLGDASSKQTIKCTLLIGKETRRCVKLRLWATVGPPSYIFLARRCLPISRGCFLGAVSQEVRGKDPSVIVWCYVVTVNSATRENGLSSFLPGFASFNNLGSSPTPSLLFLLISFREDFHLHNVALI